MSHQNGCRLRLKPGKGVIKSLANEFPDLAGDLLAIHDHIGDLIIPFRQNLYYTKAMNAFPALNDMPAEERAQMRTSLLEYCKLDTLAMVKILEKLEEAVATS